MRGWGGDLSRLEKVIVITCTGSGGRTSPISVGGVLRGRRDVPGTHLLILFVEVAAHHGAGAGRQVQRVVVPPLGNGLGVLQVGYLVRTARDEPRTHYVVLTRGVGWVHGLFLRYKYIIIYVLIFKRCNSSPSEVLNFSKNRIDRFDL